jgi:hypothetical protein
VLQLSGQGDVIDLFAAHPEAACQRNRSVGNGALILAELRVASAQRRHQHRVSLSASGAILALAVRSQATTRKLECALGIVGLHRDRHLSVAAPQRGVGLRPHRPGCSEHDLAELAAVGRHQHRQPARGHPVRNPAKRQHGIDQLARAAAHDLVPGGIAETIVLGQAGPSAL